MSRIFYDYLISLEKIEIEIKKTVELPEEREELWQIVDEILHHRIISVILDKLPQEHHLEFLENFHSAPHAESHINYLSERVVEDIEELIKFSMKNNCGIGIQKYEVHKYGRKIKKVKEQNYFQFYKKLDEWEKRFNVKLKYGASDIGVRKVKQLPVKLEKGKIYAVSVMKEGWMKGQMIGAAENRAVTLVDCDKNKGAVIKARVIENKNNIYMVK